MLSKWISDVNRAIPKSFSITLSIKSDYGRHKHSKRSFGELFSTPENFQDDIIGSIGHVHSVKGKTLEAILLVLKKTTLQNKSYTGLFNCDIQEHEELRIIYVAITRKLLILAVSQDTLSNWKKKFLNSK